MRQSTRRLLAYGGNATLVTAMVLGLVVVVYLLADRYRARTDWSEGASNTLQSDTLAKLALLDEDARPVTITAFSAQRGNPDAWFKDRALKDLLREVGEQSAVVEWRFVDFDQERLTAESLGVTEYGRVVVQRGSDRVDLKDRELFRRAGKDAAERVEFVGEAAFSRAFAQLMTPSRRAVYVLTGHGDLDPADKGPAGLSELAALLDQERYELSTLDLLRTGADGALPSIPDDAAAVLVARPARPLSPPEEDALLAWVGRGGSLLVAVDVGTAIPLLLGRLGVIVPEGVALQPEMQVPYRDRPIPRYRGHPITGELDDRKVATVLALPAPLRLMEPPPAGVRAAPVLSTTRDGWVDRGGALVGGMAVYEPAIDGQGPVDLAYAFEAAPGQGLVRAGKPAARVLVLGDGDLLTNSLVGEAPGNGLFAVNAVHWLAGEDRRLGAALGAVGKATRSRRLALTDQELGLLRAASLGVMPLIVLFFGIATWLSRRGR